MEGNMRKGITCLHLSPYQKDIRIKSLIKFQMRSLMQYLSRIRLVALHAKPWSLQAWR